MNHKLNSIQVLRAVAVLLVVYIHATLSIYGQNTITRPFSMVFYELVHWGAIGVDLFFVISGFIMTRIALSYAHPKGWIPFLAKRLIRIVPLYWAISALSFLLLLRNTPFNKLITSVSVDKTLFFFPIRSDLTYKAPMLGVGWSLGYEMYFYLILTLCLALVPARLLFGCVIGLLTALSALGWAINPTHQLGIFLTSPLLLEFAMGIGCGMLYDYRLASNRPNKVLFWLCLIVGLFCMLGSIFWGYDAIHAPDTFMLSNRLALLKSVCWGLPCALFLLGYVGLGTVYSVRQPNWLVWIGDASYSNYLLHTLLIIYLYKTMIRLHIINGDLYVGILMVLATVISLGAYTYVEKPLTSRLSRYFFPSKRRALEPVR